MEEPLGSQIATSAVPGSAFARVPSSNRMAGGSTQPGGEPVSWDEMGQLGLHKALNEYYKLSASQRELRLCSRGGPPGVLCTLLHTLLVPQLPAALAPPALLAAAGALLYAAAWLLYNTAALTIPLALWAAFAADGSLALTPAAAAAAAQLLPEAAHPLPLPLPLAHSRGAALLLLPALLLALRLSEAAVLRHRQQRCEAARRAVTTAGVQAHFAGWALPGSGGSGGASPSAQGLDHAVGGAAHHEQQQAALQRQQEAALRREVGQLWQAVYGEGVHADHLQTLQDVAAAVGRLCKDTGVPVPATAAASGSDNDGALLLGLVQQIKAAVGVA